MPIINKRVSPEELDKRNEKNIIGPTPWKLNDREAIDKYYNEYLKGTLNEKEKPKAYDKNISLHKEPAFERDYYYHANVYNDKLSKMSAKEKEKFHKELDDTFDNIENLILYVKSVFPKKYNKNEIIQRIRLEKRGYKTREDIDKFILDNNIVKQSVSVNKKIEKLIKEITESSKPKTKLKTSNVSRAMNLIEDVINQPKKKVYKDDMDDVKSIIMEIEKLIKKKPKDLKKLVNADKVHLKYHPSEQDKKEAKIDKASLLLKSPNKKKNSGKAKLLDGMTDVEIKKFNQARNYYMRKSKESTILPKGLNKSDPERLNNVCKKLAVKGFDTMSEYLFMKIYNKYLTVREQGRMKKMSMKKMSMKRLSIKKLKSKIKN